MSSAGVKGIKLITANDIVDAGPCPDYPYERVAWLAGDGITARQIAALDEISVDGCLMVLIHMVLDDRSRRLLACDCAERTLQRERDRGVEPDARSCAAIEVARRYARGEAAEGEMSDAEAGAWAAVEDAERKDAALDPYGAVAASHAAARNAKEAVKEATEAAAAESAEPAARDAVNDRVWDTIWNEVWAVARVWQLQRAVEYAEGTKK